MSESFDGFWESGKGFGETIFRSAAGILRAQQSLLHLYCRMLTVKPQTCLESSVSQLAERVVTLAAWSYYKWKSLQLTLPGWQQPMTWWCTLSCKIKWTRLWKTSCSVSPLRLHEQISVCMGYTRLYDHEDGEKTTSWWLYQKCHKCLKRLIKNYS